MSDQNPREHPGQTPHPSDPAEGPDTDAPLGGDETTEEQLTADNDVERDTLKTLDPDDPPA